jgi:fatty-acyl-CoA synthase
LACVVVKPGATVTTAHIDDRLGRRFAKWWVPDAMVFMDTVAKTSLGNFDKTAWREPFKDVQLATASGPAISRHAGAHSNRGAERSP